MPKRNYTAIFIGATLIGTGMIAWAKQPENDQTAEKLLQPQVGVGARYGARDPLTCKSTKAPAQGAPTAEQARAYLIGEFEGETGGGSLGELFLIESVKLEIGQGRPYYVKDDPDDADQQALVYAVRGSITYYRCYPISSAHPEGQSCKKIEWPNADGICYKTVFGDWKCSMSDTRTYRNLDGYFAAPK